MVARALSRMHMDIKRLQMKMDSNNLSYQKHFHDLHQNLENNSQTQNKRFEVLEKKTNEISVYMDMMNGTLTANMDMMNGTLTANVEEQKTTSTNVDEIKKAVEITADKLKKAVEQTGQTVEQKTSEMKNSAVSGSLDDAMKQIISMNQATISIQKVPQRTAAAKPDPDMSQTAGSAEALPSTTPLMQALPQTTLRRLEPLSGHASLAHTKVRHTVAVSVCAMKPCHVVCQT